MTIIPDKEQAAKAQVAKEWPRPESVPCSCGGTAHQTVKGAPQYACLKCSTTITMWTGFDDPAWF